MIVSDDDFDVACMVLDGLTGPFESGERNELPSCYHNQHIVAAAVHILHKAVMLGSAEQKEHLLAKRHKICALNDLLRRDDLREQVNRRLGLDMEEAASRLQGTQIALPQTRFEYMIDVITRIPRAVLAFDIELVVFPFLSILLLVAASGMSLDPIPVKTDKTPILLLHGAGFNEAEWLFSRPYLAKEEYGSVFSLSYDGLMTNDPQMGIEDYARGIVRDKIREIQRITGQNKLIVIGHSMGGMIGTYYAEHLAAQDGISVDHIMSIASPWHGAPVIDWMWLMGGPWNKEDRTKRHQQMSMDGGTKDNPTFRVDLVAQALDSERKGLRKYYSVWSTTDYAVSGNTGCLTEDPRRQLHFNYLGHYILAAWPSIWCQVRSWLDDVYRQQSKSPC